MTAPYVLRPLNEEPDGPDKPKPGAQGYTLRPLTSAPVRVASDATNVSGKLRDPLAFYDQTTGAPARVRVALSAAGSPADQLETLKRFYPDAHIAPGGKLAFTNPATGKKTLVNEKWGAGKFLGFSAGDIAASAPVVGELLGAIGGGVAGAAAGAAGGPAAPATVPGGAMGGRVIGAGLGMAGGKALGNIIAKAADYFTNDKPAVDTRSPGEIATEGVRDVARGAAFEMGGAVLPRLASANAIRNIRQGGRVIKQGGKAFAKSMSAPGNSGLSGALESFGDALRSVSRGEGRLPADAMTALGGRPVPAADAMMRRGITRPSVFGAGPALPITALTESHALRGIGEGLEQGLGGGSLEVAKREAREALAARVAKEAEETAALTTTARRNPNVELRTPIETPGVTPLAPDEAAGAARAAVRNNSEAVLVRQNNSMLHRAFDGESGKATVDINPVRQLRDKMAALAEESPDILGPQHQEALEQLNRLVRTAEGRTVTETVPSPIGALDGAGNPIMQTVERQVGGGVRLRDMRTVMQDVGETMAGLETALKTQGKATGGATGPLREAYATLTQEIERHMDPKALDAWKRQRALVTARHSLDNPAKEAVMQKALRNKADNAEASRKLLLEPRPRDRPGAVVSRVAEVRRTTPVPEWAALRGTRVGQLGQKKVGGEMMFDSKQFLKDLGNFSEAEQRAWGLSKDQMQVLKDLKSASQVIVQRGLEKATLSTNNVLYVVNKLLSGGTNTLAGLAGASAGAAAGGASGAVLGGLAGVAGAQTAQFGLAKVLASPAIGRWFATTMRVVADNPNALSAQLGRLLALKATHPDQAEEIESYYQQIQAAQNAEAPRR